MSNVCRQEIEENPPVVELDFLHSVSLLFSLMTTNVRTAVSAFPTFTTRGQTKTLNIWTDCFTSETRNDEIALQELTVKYMIRYL